MSSVPSRSVSDRSMPNQNASPPIGGRRKSSKSKGNSEGVRDSLELHLRRTAQFIKFMDALVLVFAWGAVALCIWLLASVVDHWLFALPTALRWGVWLAGVSATTWWGIVKLLPLLLQKINPIYAAHRIEHLVPEFKNGLISWLELEAMSDSGVPRGVMAAIRYRAARFIGGQDPSATVDTSPLIKLVATTLLLTTGMVVYMMVSPKSALVTGQRILMPWTSIEPPTRVHILDVKPGDVELTQGKPLEVDIELKGLYFDESVYVRFSTLDGQFVNQLVELSPVTEGFRYGGNVTTSSTGVEQELDYWIEAGDTVAGPFRVTLNPLPSVTVESVELRFPEYTGLNPRIIQAGGEAEAVEGTLATIRATANQSLTRGRLEINPELDSSGELVRAEAFKRIDVEDRKLVGEWSLLLNAAGENPSLFRYRVRGYNASGDMNPQPIQYELSVFADMPPEVDLLGPESRVMKVSPTSKINLEVRASDPDYGLTAMELSVRRNALQTQTVRLLDDPGIQGKQVRTQRINISAMKASVGDTIQVIATARDNRHDPVSGKLAPNTAKSQILTLQVVEPEKADPESAMENGREVGESELVEGEASGNPSEQSGASGQQQNGTGNSDSGSQSTGSQNTGNSGNGNQSASNEGSNNQQPNNQGSSETAPDNSGGSETQSENGTQSGNGSGQSGEQSGSQSKSEGEDSGTGSGSGGGESGEQGSQESSQQSSGAGGSGQPSGNQNSSQPSSQSGSGSGSNSEGNSSQQNPGGANSSSDSGSPNGTAGSNGGSGNSNGPSAQDRQTMERIKDYVESQQNGDASQTPSGSPPSGERGSKSAGGTPPAGEGANGSEAGGSSPENGSAKADSSPGQNPQGQNSGSSNGDSSAGDSSQGQPQPQSPSGSNYPNPQPGEGSKSGGSDGQPSNAQDSSGANSGDNASGDNTSGDNTAGDSKPGQQPPGNQSSNDSGADPKAAGSKTGDAKTNDRGGSNEAQGNKNSDQGQAAQNGSQNNEQPNEGSSSSKTPQDGSSQNSEAQSGSQSGSGEAGDSGSQESSRGSKSNDQPSTEKGSGSSAGEQGDPQSGSSGEGASGESSGNASSGSNDSGAEGSSGQKNGNGEAGQSGTEGQEAKQGSGTEGSQPDNGSKGNEASSNSQTEQSSNRSDSPGSSKGTSSEAESQGSQATGSESSESGAPGSSSSSSSNSKSNAAGESSQRAEPGQVPQGGGASSSGGQGGGSGVNDSANADYTNENTEMVLDYLERQRDQPDPELLKELSWTKDDLNGFVDRWKNARDLSNVDAQRIQDPTADDLQRLGGGLGRAGAVDGSKVNDAFRQQQDGGNRIRPPERLRKQYDAFRKALESRGNK